MSGKAPLHESVRLRCRFSRQASILLKWIRNAARVWMSRPTQGLSKGFGQDPSAQESGLKIRSAQMPEMTKAALVGRGLSEGGLVDLSGESSNHLFQVLSDWELHLASFETDLSRCDNDNIVP